MTKRTVLWMLLCCGWSVGALGQKPWNCNTSNHLICLVPVATLSIGSPLSPAPAFNATFATQLSQLPLLSSSSGIVLTLDRTLGVYVALDNLGPILTDRAQTIGKHKLLLAFAYQRFRFNSIDGTNLKDVPFFFSSAPMEGVPTTYSVQQDRIDFKLDQYVGLATFGLTDKTDISVIMPFARVSIGANSGGTVYSVCCGKDGMTPNGSGLLPLAYTAGSASGIGDMLVNVKSVLWSGEKTKVSGGLLVRFPTGDALNYLGSGAYGFNPYAIVSYQARVSPHARLGYQFNTTSVLSANFDSAGNFTGNSGLPGGLQYDVGADTVLFTKVPTSLAADVLGTYIRNSPILTLQSQTVPGYNVTVPSLAPPQPTGKSSYNSTQFSIGLKVKPWKTLILYGNVLFQMNNVGLRSNDVPLAGVSYTFF